jgi:hypothetical protein
MTTGSGHFSESLEEDVENYSHNVMNHRSMIYM